MTFTARIDSISRAGDPGMFDVGVTYLESTLPDWRVAKILRVTIDPAQAVAQQRSALQSVISADAQLYRQQLTIHAGLQALVDQVITLP